MEALEKFTDVSKCLNFISNIELSNDYEKIQEIIKIQKTTLTAIVFLMKSIFFKLDDIERKLCIFKN